MCQNAHATLDALLTGERPTLISVLNIAGIENSAQGQSIIKDYDAATAAIAAWTPGTASQEVIEVLTALQANITLIPIPATYQLMLNVVIGGIITVLGIVRGNSPAPAPSQPVAEGAAEPQHVQAMHAAAVMADTEQQVQVLVPTFKRSIFHSADHQYRKAWNDAVDECKAASTYKV